MFLKIYILPLLAFILVGANSCILASLSDEESPKLFNVSGNKASHAKIRTFLSPCFEIKKLGQVKLISEPEPAIELLGKFSTQFVKETASKIANKETLKGICWTSYKRFKELTVETSHTAAPFFHIGRFSVEEATIVSIENALTSKVKVRKHAPPLSASTSQILPPSEVSSFVLTHTRNAFATIKQMTCLGLLTILKDLGENVDVEFAQHKTNEVPLDNSEASLGGEGEEDEDWDEMLRSTLNKIDTQNKAYQIQRTKYLELLSEWEKVEALERAIPKKEHLVECIFSFLGVDEEEHETMKEYLFTERSDLKNKPKSSQGDSDEEPETSAHLDAPLEIKALGAKNADIFLQNLQKHVQTNLLVERDNRTIKAPIKKIVVAASLLYERSADKDIQVEIEDAENHFDANRGKLNVLAREVKNLETKIHESVKALKKCNEPLDEILGNFHAYLGGYSFKQFLDTFAFNPERPFEEKMDNKLNHFPETNKELVEGLWRFIHGIQ